MNASPTTSLSFSSPLRSGAHRAAVVLMCALGALTGCASDPEPVPLSASDAVFEVASPSAPVLVGDDIVFGGADGVLRAYRFKTGAVAERARNLGRITAVTAAPEGVVVIAHDGSAVILIDQSGGARVLAEHRVDAAWLAVDDAWAYFIDEGHMLRRTPLAGGSTERLNGDDAEKTHLILRGGRLAYRAVNLDDATPVITAFSIGKTGGRPEALDDLSARQPTALFAGEGDGGLLLAGRGGLIVGTLDDDETLREGPAADVDGAWPLPGGRILIAQSSTFSVIDDDGARRPLAHYTTLTGAAVRGNDLWYTDEGALRVVRGAL